MSIPQKDEHVAVAIDGSGGRLDERMIPATTAGYSQLQAWAPDLGRIVVSDAEHAARQVLAGTATAVPKLGDGDIESLGSPDPSRGLSQASDAR